MNQHRFASLITASSFALLLALMVAAEATFIELLVVGLGGGLMFGVCALAELQSLRSERKTKSTLIGRIS